VFTSERLKTVSCAARRGGFEGSASCCCRLPRALVFATSPRRNPSLLWLGIPVSCFLLVPPSRFSPAFLLCQREHTCSESSHRCESCWTTLGASWSQESLTCSGVLPVIAGALGTGKEQARLRLIAISGFIFGATAFILSVFYFSYEGRESQLKSRFQFQVIFTCPSSISTQTAWKTGNAVSSGGTQSHHDRDWLFSRDRHRHGIEPDL